VAFRAWLDSPEPEALMTTFTTSRQIPDTPAQVYAAISDPARLARWWGPAGKNYPNEYVFAEVDPRRRS
jgi:uncharacterized protein YndB with AHSA1/START domain